MNCRKYVLSKIRTRDGSDISPRLFPLSHWACGYQPHSAGFIVRHCLLAVVRIAYTRFTVDIYYIYLFIFYIYLYIRGCYG